MNITRRSSTRFIIHTLLVLSVFTPLHLQASKNGITGRTLKSGSNGCSCHGSLTSSYVLALVGPATLSPGETGSYRLTASSNSLRGFDVAVSSGALAVDSTVTVQLKNGELTHTTNTTVPFYEFKYTAPAQAGTVTMYAAGVETFPVWDFSPNFTITVTTPTGVATDGLIPAHVRLAQNYPNPFNPSTTIEYDLPTESRTMLTVIDLAGRTVATLAEGVRTPGTYHVQLDASRLASGLYLYRLDVVPADGVSQRTTITRKLVVLK